MDPINPDSDALARSLTPPIATGNSLGPEDYRALVESMAQAVWETDAAGKITTDSPGWRAYTGQTLEEWLGAGWVQAVHPEERAYADEQWQESLSRQTPMNAEFRLQSPDGGWRWNNVRVVPIRNAGGLVAKWVGMSIAVSRSPQSEQTLNLSQDLLQTLIEHLPGGAAFVVDRDLHYLIAGGEAIRQVGMKPDDFVGKTLTEAIGSDQAKHYETLYRQALAGEPFAYEHEAHSRKFLTHGIPLRHANQEPYAVLAVSYDITERKRAEESLRESEAYYQSVFDRMDEGYFLCEVVFDHAHVPVDILYLSANSAATQMVGQDFTGRRLRKIDSAYEDYWYDIFGRVIQTGKGERMEQYAQPDKKWYDFYVFKVSSENNRVTVVFQDITKRKRREANAVFLANLQDELSQLTNLDEIVQTVGEKFGQYLNVATCNFLDVDETQEEELKVSYTWSQTGLPSLLGTFSFQDYLTEEYKRTNRPGEVFIINDTQTDPRIQAQAYTQFGIGALVRVPFRHNGEWKFFLSVTDTKPRNWQEDEIELLTEFLNRTVPRLDRLRTEEALRQQEKRTRIAIEAANMGTWEWNLPANKVYWNEQHFLLFGMEPHEQPLSPDEFMRHVHPDDLDQIRAKLQRTIERKTVYDAEFRAVRDDGTVRWMSGYGRVTGEIDGQPVRLSGVMFDIDDRKQAHEALRQSEERFRTLVQNVRDYAIFMTDPNGIITEWTEGAQRVKGYTPEEAIGQPISFCYPPEAVATGEAYAELTQAAETGRVEREGVRVRKGGERFWVNEIATAIHDAQGRLAGFTKISRDITERKQADDALRQSEERLRIVMASITDHALITVDTQNVITGWNQGAQKLFGYSADEAIGQPGAFIYTPEDQRAGVPENEVNTARQEGRAADERYHVRKDGSRIYVSGVQSPLYDTHGQLLGYVKVARDLTERQQMEQALRDADRRKDEFLAMLAHELRNPLAPIRNILQILQLTSADNETIGPSVAMMSRQVDHLVRLIDDLLDVSRISRGKVELRRERIDFATVVRQAAEAARPLYDSQGRDLQVNVPTFPIYLQGDATRLTQVVANLLTNGVRYTHSGGHVWLTLTVTEEPSDREEQRPNGEAPKTDQRPVAILRVRDDGIGLTPDQLKQIFDLFVQIDTALDRSQGGLGLGLTLVKQLVEMHDGRVEAHSAGLDQGSEFIVTLPILQKPIKEMNVRNEPIAATTSGHRVLVVDDNRDAADTLAMLLKLKKHEVHVRYSGRKALEDAENLQPEVILLDISMPELDGYETARLIRQQPWGKSVLLIALTGYGQQEDKRRSTEAGFDSHLVKPVDLPALMQLFNSLPTSPNGN